jgi:predicted GNAT family N-acyltransferase
MSLASPPVRGPLDAEPLRAFGAIVAFRRGEVLRERGRHYRDMFWLIDGGAKVDFGDEPERVATVVAGWPIGEIGFLLGTPAVATVTAASPITALVIDDAAFARLEREQPALAARFLRAIGEIADRRTNANTTFAGASNEYVRPDAIDIRLCRSRDMLEAAQRLRYDVYCGELGRTSPYADPDRKIITDALDPAGYTFIAVEGDEIIGTLRLNFARDGELGVLEELYGMKSSAHHPAGTAICTKFIVRKAKRRSPAAIKLIATITRHCTQNGIKEIYIDCIPALLPYYKAIGFKVVAPSFFHRENGTSHPMMIDVDRYKHRWNKDMGLVQYIHLYLKAKAIRWLDALRAARAPRAPVKEATT